MNDTKERGISILDVLAVLIVVGVLLFAATREFSRYGPDHLPGPSPSTATTTPGQKP